MRRSLLVRGLFVGLLAALLVPRSALAQADPKTAQALTDELNNTWVIVAAFLVMFMQAGFLLLELGFTRGKNVGTMVAKILVNFSVASVMWWICGFAIAFGGDAVIAGDSGFLVGFGDTVAGAPFDGAGATFFFFQFAFAAVSLAIVWGTTLERIKFVAYPIYGIVFAGLIYPLIAHWGFGGGLFAEIGNGVQDFAGSTVVHLTGATGALAALLLLGPRKGKFGPDGKPRAIPGHSMPLFGLGVLILWLGWFGFNPGSTLNTDGSRFAEVVVVTNLAAAAGVIGASLTVFFRTKTLDVGMCGNGAIAALVAITAPSGYVEFWAAPIIGLIAGVLVVFSVYAIDKLIDDPVGALSAHGMAGIWGTLSCGIFSSPRLTTLNGVGDAGLVYSGSLKQLGVQAAGVGLAFVTVFVLSYATFFLIKVTVGLRVSEEDEEAGLDISEHGMYGYPEQFIPSAELVSYGAAPQLSATQASATKSTEVNA